MKIGTLVAAVALVIGAAFVLRHDPCAGWFLVRDSQVEISKESSELVKGAQAAYAADPENGSQLLAKPVSVSVDGMRATIIVDGPMYAGDLRYAQVWHSVFHSVHGGNNHCVRLTIAWRNGSIEQVFPPSDI